MNGIELIAAEHQRQIEREGFTLQHDDSERPGALTMAAVCYATIAGSSDGMRDMLRYSVPRYWPQHWRNSWWKPGQDNTHAARIRELTKAGALLAAEIDRLQRQENTRAYQARLGG